MMFFDAPIINGAYDANDPAVVQIYAYPPAKNTLYTCTGTLISPTHVLAAAHCFAHDANYIYGIYEGPDADQYNGQIAQIESHLKMAASVAINPSYQATAPFLADIGILTLAQPITDVTPLEFNRTVPDATLIGAMVKIVGYGQTTYGTFQNDKYAATTVIADLDNGADTILVGGSGSDARPCLGDSGGPVLLGNVIYGVDSYSAEGCTDPAHYRRTDAYQTWIDSIVSPGTGSGSDGSGSGSDAEPAQTEPDGDGGGCNTGHSVGILAALSVVLLRRRR